MFLIKAINHTFVLLRGFFRIFISLMRFISEHDPWKSFQKIEYTRKHYPRDSEELKKLNIENF